MTAKRCPGSARRDRVATLDGALTAPHTRLPGGPRPEPHRQSLRGSEGRSLATLGPRASGVAAVVGALRTAQPAVLMLFLTNSTWLDRRGCWELSAVLASLLLSYRHVRQMASKWTQKRAKKPPLFSCPRGSRAAIEWCAIRFLDELARVVAGLIARLFGVSAARVECPKPW